MDGTGRPTLLDHVSGTFVGLLYLIFGMADLGCSLLAFRLGVPEGNPVLAWMAARGLFVPAKVVLTLLATVLIGLVYRRPRARPICWASVVLMVLVDSYHVVALTGLLRGLR